MSDEAALLKAIISHADEDTPRLAYADWLDEHGDPDRAAFIRVQCRLADMPPNHPEWADLAEQQDELLARVRHRPNSWGKDPKRFYFSTTYIESFSENFRRGFPYSISCSTSGKEWNPREVRRVCDELTRLVRTSTIRGFHISETPAAFLRELLAAPVVKELTSLDIFPGVGRNSQADLAECYRVAANNPALRGVRELFLYSGLITTSDAAVSALAEATTFDSVRRLTIQSLDGSKESLDKLTASPWFRRLRHFRSQIEEDTAGAAVAAGLGHLPELHTLDLPGFAPGGVAALATGKFQALGRLLYGSPLDADTAQMLARTRFPALVELKACGRDYGGRGGATDDSLAALLKADWFAQLRVLKLSGNSIGDKGLKALAAHPVAKTLRRLALGDNVFGKRGFAALAKPDTFPALTTLDLHSHHKRKATSADLATFLSRLQTPNLRHLDLENWPVGNEGAKAIAGNPAFANLTRLHLCNCYIGDPGAKAIFASPHLQNLVGLRLAANCIKSGANALADPTVMPRLAQCWVNYNKIPEATAKKFQRNGLDLAV